MRFCISHASAAQFWCWASREEGIINEQNEIRASQGLPRIPMPSHAAHVLLSQPRTDEIPVPVLKKNEVIPFVKAKGMTMPLDVLINDWNQKRKQSICTCHLQKAHRIRAFVPFGGVLLCSPALCLAQMASSLSELELLLLAYEFCGRYVLDPQAPRGFLKRAPLTAVNEVRGIAELMYKTRGVKRLKRVLKYVADDSASPRETALTAALTLPGSGQLMGYGFTLPALNYSIVLRAKASAVYGKKSCVCDLYWPGIDVEYDSDLEHGGECGGAVDSLRAAALSLESIEVVHVYSKNLTSPNRLDAMAKLIGEKIGQKPLELSGAKYRTRVETQRRLFSRHVHPFAVGGVEYGGNDPAHEAKGRIIGV